MNATTMDASQIASFIMDHRDSLREFNLQDIALRTGSLDDPLAPLTPAQRQREIERQAKTPEHRQRARRTQSIWNQSAETTASTLCGAATERRASQLSQDAGALEGLGEARSYEAAATVIGV